jgi:hypothetical protein
LEVAEVVAVRVVAEAVAVVVAFLTIIPEDRELRDRVTQEERALEPIHMPVVVEVVGGQWDRMHRAPTQVREVQVLRLLSLDLPCFTQVEEEEALRGDLSDREEQEAVVQVRRVALLRLQAEPTQVAVAVVVRQAQRTVEVRAVDPVLSSCLT